MDKAIVTVFGFLMLLLVSEVISLPIHRSSDFCLDLIEQDQPHLISLCEALLHVQKEKPVDSSDSGYNINLFDDSAEIPIESQYLQSKYRGEQYPGLAEQINRLYTGLSINDDDKVEMKRAGTSHFNRFG